MKETVIKEGVGEEPIKTKNERKCSKGTHRLLHKQVKIEPKNARQGRLSGSQPTEAAEILALLKE